jgi:hypothetical protein
MTDNERLADHFIKSAPHRGRLCQCRRRIGGFDVVGFEAPRDSALAAQREAAARPRQLGGFSTPAA